jgi:hypothetical protein
MVVEIGIPGCMSNEVNVNYLLADSLSALYFSE